jgi:anti-sigma B factor antagonist
VTVLTAPPAAQQQRISVETINFDATQALIKVTGEIDLSTAAALWAVLQCHLTAGRRFLRLDLAGVTLLDRTVVGGLARAHHELLERRGTLVIIGVRALVARVLHVTGMDQQLFIAGPRTGDDLPAGLPRASADAN